MIKIGDTEDREVKFPDGVRVVPGTWDEAYFYNSTTGTSRYVPLMWAPNPVKGFAFKHQGGDDWEAFKYD